MKKILVLVSALAVMAFCNVVGAANDFAAVKSMLDTAERIVPANAEIVSTEEGAETTLLVYVDEETMTYYDLSFNTATLKLEKMRAQSSNIIGSTMMSKTVGDIEKIVLQEYPEAADLEITTVKDGLNTCYKAAFDTADYRAVLKLNPVTGAIGERVLFYK